jgi:Ser/Thr protein kinase RdoA (MazF antagonist)
MDAAAGSQQEMRTELTDLLKGYEQFLPFDRRELALIEPLRALRMIHYSAWLARRWDDPAFPGFSLVRRTALLGGALSRARGSAGCGAGPPLEL